MRHLRGSCSVFADALGLVPCHVSCLAWLAPCSACLARLACSIRLPIPHAPAQWSDRPQGRSAGVTARVGLGPLCHGYVFVRESVVGQRWGFILCGRLSNKVVCPLEETGFSQIAGELYDIACHVPAPQSNLGYCSLMSARPRIASIHTCKCPQ